MSSPQGSVASAPDAMSPLRKLRLLMEQDGPPREGVPSGPLRPLGPVGPFVMDMMTSVGFMICENRYRCVGYRGSAGAPAVASGV